MTADSAITGSGSVAAPDVSVIVTGHREGATCRPTFAALCATIEAAADVGITVEVVGVLDRADAATVAIFESVLAEDGAIGRLARARIRVTDHGDPGAARNDGVRDTRAPWVCVLDGDNLPSRSWLPVAFRVAAGHGAPCVVHPEHLVIFGDRWQVWPQLPSDHPGFRAHNFFDRTYWDTFCLASREVFTTLPYARTAAAQGLGPEDWHWGMETIHAGIDHLSASGTALLYRSRSSGSVQGGHETAHSLLPPSPLLVDPVLAASSREPPHTSRPTWRGLQRAIVRQSLGRSTPTALPAPAPSGWRRQQAWPDHVRFLYPDLADLPDRRLRSLVRDSIPGHSPLRGCMSDEELDTLTQAQFNPLHYRALHAEVLRMGNGQATLHYLDTGRAHGLRARLSEQELRDVVALDLDDYRALHDDLADLADADLLHHYLAHGRAEGRSASMTVEQRDARRQVRLDDELIRELQALHTLEPDIPEPSPARLAELVHVGPPSDGSMTRGSHVWWQVVEALGPALPDVVVYVSQLTADADPDATCGRVLRHIPPDHRVAIVATRGSSALPVWMDSEVVLVDLHHTTGWGQLAEDERRRLVATLVVQLQPDVVHAVDSPEFAAALEQYGRALRSSTSIRLA